MSPILTTLEIADLVEPIVFFDASDPVSHLIGTLKESKSYEVFVEDKSRTASVSVRELLNVENIASTKLASIVLPVPRIEVTDSMLYVARLMFEHKIRALPVYKNEKVLGKITSRSIIKSILESTRNSKVSLAEIMTPNPICIKTSDSVAKARSMMLRRKIDQLPILDDSGKLNGVITSDSIVFSSVPSAAKGRDVKGGKHMGRFGNAASSFSSREVTTNGIRDSLQEAFQNMLRFSTNYSIVLNADSVVGIVTFRDFLKLLPLEEISVRSPVSIVGLPNNPLEAELVESKFKSAVKLLQKTLPKVDEARAVIKSKKTNSAKTLFQVQVFINAGEWHQNYKTDGYDLGKVFGEIDAWIKRLASQHSEKEIRTRKARR